MYYYSYNKFHRIGYLYVKISALHSLKVAATAPPLQLLQNPTHPPRIFFKKKELNKDNAKFIFNIYTQYVEEK